MSNKKRILLVDDEGKFVVALKIRLEKSGYQVSQAYDGEEALSKARSENPDLIILDLMLPKVDGFMICSLLKKDDRYKHIPIIICSSRIREEDKELGRKVGADAYITKPFDSQDLMDTIKRLLSGNKPS